MDPASITTWAMGVGFVLYVAWDIYVAFFNDVPNSKDTISGQARETGIQRVSGLPFAFGVLGGHFWGPADVLPGWTPFLLIPIAVLLSVIHRKLLPKTWWVAMLHVVIGLGAGAVLWSQS